METLIELGLTNYESKAYVSLLSSGITGARDISSKSKIPFGRIYDVLTLLETKGLIERQITRPMKFLALKPSTALKKLLDNKNDELQQLTEKTAKLEVDLNNKFKAPSEESSFWRFVVEKQEYGKVYFETLQEAKKELLLCIPLSKLNQHFADCKDCDVLNLEIPSIDTLITTFLEIIAKAIDKGVKIKLLLVIDKEDIMEHIMKQVTPFLSYINRIEIRTCSENSIAYDVIDGEKVLLNIHNPGLESELIGVIYIWQRNFAKRLRENYLKIWEKSKEFEINIQ